MLADAARVSLDASGAVAGYSHFVLASDLASDVTGLPSSSVRDVLAIDAGTAYLACGMERVDASPFDRAVEPLFMLDGEPRPGGVARVLGDDTVAVVVDGALAPDARAIAFDWNGDLVVADALVGLLRVTPAGVETFDPGLPIPAGSIPQVLWFGAGDELAVGYDTGLAIRFGGSEGFVGEVGWVWDISLRGETLLVATDEGLLRIRAPGASDLPVTGIEVGLPPAFEAIAPPVEDPGGDCIPKGASCGADPDGCCSGLSCVFGFVQTCE